MKIIESKNATWIDIKNPVRKDVEYLNKKFEFHPFILKSVIPPIRHPRFENYGEYSFLVLHYPYFDKCKKETRAIELDILITKDTIITIHYEKIEPLKFFFGRLSTYEKEKQEFTDEGIGELLYRILNNVLRDAFPKLDHIDEKIDIIEKEILKGSQKAIIEDISILKHDIINFQRVVQPQITVFDSLKNSSISFFGQHYYPYYNELYNCFSTIKEVLQTHHKTLNELEDTNSNLLSLKTNDIIKVLTVFTVILTPLGLIANFFGMNTSYLPFAGSQNDFWFVFGMSLTFLLITTCYAHKKGWLQ